MDILFRATSKRALYKLGKGLNFIEEYTDENGKKGWATIGCSLDYWQGITVVPGEYDQDGNVTKAPIRDNAWFLNLRLRPKGALLDRIDVDDDGTLDQWEKSKIARWMKNQGVERNHVTKHPSGGTRKYFTKDFGGGDVVQLIWPIPTNQKRVWF